MNGYRMSMKQQLMATAIVSVIAPALTGILTFVAATVRLGNELPGPLFQVLFVPVYAIALGFIGAFLFLAPAMWLASAKWPTKIGFAMAGALAGALHSVVGIAYWNATPMAVHLTDFGVWFGWVLGFMLLGSAIPWYVVASAAVLAGAVAGLVFARIYRRSVASRRWLEEHMVSPPGRIDPQRHAGYTPASFEGH